MDDMTQSIDLNRNECSKPAPEPSYPCSGNAAPGVIAFHEIDMRKEFETFRHCHQSTMRAPR
jgi:hypothetical protein